MKVITPGTIARTKPQWWHGLHVSCPACDGRFELQEGDDKPGPMGDLPNVVVHAERHAGGKQWVEVKCPTRDADLEICGATIRNDRIYQPRG